MRILIGLFLVSRFFHSLDFHLNLNGPIILSFPPRQIPFILAQSKLKQTSLIDNIKEHKDLKKTLRTKNNVLILYTSNHKSAQNVIKALDEAAQSVKGEATAILIDCSMR